MTVIRLASMVTALLLVSTASADAQRRDPASIWGTSQRDARVSDRDSDSDSDSERQRRGGIWGVGVSDRDSDSDSDSDSDDRGWDRRRDRAGDRDRGVSLPWPLPDDRRDRRDRRDDRDRRTIDRPLPWPLPSNQVDIARLDRALADLLGGGGG